MVSSKRKENSVKPSMKNNRLKQVRLRQHKTQKDVATAIGVSDRAIAHYEKGIREPNLETWIKLSKVFNLPVDFLQGNSFSPYQQGQNDSFAQFAYDYGLLSETDGEFNNLTEQDKEKISFSLISLKHLLAILIEADQSLKSPIYKKYLNNICDLLILLQTPYWNEEIHGGSQRIKVIKTFNTAISEFERYIKNSDIGHLIFQDNNNGTSKRD